MTLVFTNGCFNLLHVGHVRLLNFAREQGSRLIVGLNSDESVLRLKGYAKLIIPEDERREILLALNVVDDVMIFDEDTPERLIARLRPRPDVLVKGPAERGRVIAGAAFVESYGGRVAIPDWPVEHSTTRMIERIVRGQ